ncbi:MAG: WYL domain-containing protein [Thermodesulfovibrionales bacterium]
MGQKNIYERFLWFEQRVKARKYPNATKLAKEFEMSSKTAQRDIEFMRDRLNCPLLYDSQQKGYYYKDETFSLPAIYLSSGELSSLLMAKKLLEDMSAESAADDITSAVNKITSIIKKHSSSPDRIDEALSFHLIAYSPTPEGVFNTALESCLRRKSLAFKYSSPAHGETTERKADPYHLVNYMGSWHVIAYCHTRKDVRDFKLGRMTNPRILDESFWVQRDFNFKEYFQTSFGLYKGKTKEMVTLRFTPEKSRWIGDQIWHRDQKEKLLPDCALELSFPVSDFSEIAREVLKHGSGVEVVSPKKLRDQIRAEALKIADIYA